MADRLVLDANVFYDLGAGRLRTEDIVEGGEHLWYSPLTTLELAAKWSSRTFEDRRRAAAAILETGAQELPDTDVLLTRDVFGYAPSMQQLSLHHAVKAMASAGSMKELTAGVPDYVSRVTRKVSITKAAEVRSVTEAKWVRDLVELQKSIVPGFSSWYNPDPRKRNGKVPRLSGKNKQEFLAQTTTFDWAVSIVVACQSRARLSAIRGELTPPSKETVKTLMQAIELVSCYCAVYTQYLIRLMTAGALPSANDSTDIELFLYSANEKTVVVTSDQKWRSIADAAGFGGRVRVP